MVARTPLLILSLLLLLCPAACRKQNKTPSPPPDTSVSAPLKAAAKLPDGRPACHPTSPVGGTIKEDTRWCGLVQVHQNLLVPKGVTLTLAPGTKLLFKAYRGYKEPQRRLRLRVEGRLLAQGTTREPIFFTTAARDARNGDWSMVKLVSSTGSRLRHCVFEFAQHGLNIWNTDIELERVVIRFNNWEGLYAENHCSVTLRDSRVYANGYNCVAVEQFVKLRVEGSYIANCGTTGLHLDASTAEVEGNLIEGSQEGLSLDNDASAVVRRNRFTSQKNNAISCGGGKNTITLGLNTFDGIHPDLAVDCEGGEVKEVASKGRVPVALNTGAVEGSGAYLDYIPGERRQDPYLYVFPDEDETRKVVRKLGSGIGLAWSVTHDGENLWTANLEGVIYRLHPVSGEVLTRFKAPGPQPWGLAHDGKLLWVVDFAREMIHGLDPKTGLVKRKFPSPDPAGGCKGLTYDGEHLYALGWATHKLYKLGPTGEVLGSVPAPWREVGGGVRIYAAGGLAWDGEAFWAPADQLLRFDRQGKLLGYVHATSERVWDMAWDGKALWTTQRANENWRDYPRLFRVKLLKVVPVATVEGRR